MTRTQFPLAICLLLSAAAAHAAERPEREKLGREVKLRIVVDKVMQKHADWVTEEWMIRASAEAGFNVYSPRQGGEDANAVRRVTRWCGAHGIYHLPWMRGTRRAPAGTPEAERLVWADGTVSKLYSPNADGLWEWMGRRIVGYAKLAAGDETLLGVFLDYENYEPTGKPNGYALSYDMGILRRFAAERDVDLPADLPPAERKAWLGEAGLHDAFEAFQVSHWRTRCRALRQAVDRHAPGFRFCVYPAPGTKLMTEAIYPEWAAGRAPLILADATTYGRPPFMPLPAALAYNRRKLLERRKVPRQAGIRFAYAGGIDPAVRGADPEFSGKNAVMISQATDGYWIFYEGPTYTREDHRRYWKWFARANRAIAAGNWAFQHEPRESPREWNFQLWKRLSGFRPGAVRGPAETATRPGGEPVLLRGENLLLIAAEKGRRVAVTLGNVPIADYDNVLLWTLRDPSRKLLGTGKVPMKRAGEVGFTPEADGTYMLAVSAGRCAYVVAGADAAVGVYAGPRRPLAAIRGAKRLWFHVPPGTKRFAVGAEGRGRETVRVEVYDAGGTRVAAGETTPDQETVTVPVTVDGREGGTWSLAMTRAETGTLEDASVALSGLAAPVLSLTPETAWRPAD